MIAAVLTVFVLSSPISPTTDAASTQPTFALPPIERLSPLDSNPSLVSDTPLHRACAPGEALVARIAQPPPTSEVRGLEQGQFVTCVGDSGDNSNADDSRVRVVDGPGTVFTLPRHALLTTCGFPRNWTACDREILVWAYSHDTIILRESLCGSFEGNFMYLLLGDAAAPQPRALLIDTGTGYSDIKPYVLPLIGTRQLVAVSTHNHWDHFGGHRRLRGHATLLGHKPGETYDPFGPYDLAGVQAAFGLTHWPHDIAEYDLGHRIISVIPIPGHTRDAVAFYDSRDALLFTSDSVTPGILFIDDWEHAVSSLQRLEHFAATHPVKWVLGGHIEMSALRSNGLYEYFYYGRGNHVDEHPLYLRPEHIHDVRLAMQEVRANAGKALPRYDALQVERVFHSQPFVVVPGQGVEATYYNGETERLLRTLRERLR